MPVNSESAINGPKFTNLSFLWISILLLTLIYFLLLFLHVFDNICSFIPRCKVENSPVITITKFSKNLHPRSSLHPIYFIQDFVAVIIAFLFLTWSYYATLNLKAFKVSNLAISPLGAALWWFVPIVFFWKPYQAMTQIWRATLYGEQWRTAKAPPKIGVWWGLFLGNVIIAALIIAAATLALEYLVTASSLRRYQLMEEEFPIIAQALVGLDIVRICIEAAAAFIWIAMLRFVSKTHNQIYATQLSRSAIAPSPSAPFPQSASIQ